MAGDENGQGVASALWALVEGGAAPGYAGFALLALALGVGWLSPTLLWLTALTALAVRPEGEFDYVSGLGFEWGVQHSLIALALAVSALRYGIRRTINWPILALLVTFALSLLLGQPHPELTPALMLMSLALLALPWAFTQVQAPPEGRGLCILLIVLAPFLSLAVGAFLGIDGLLDTSSVRLRGATGNAALFAMLAFAGLAVALHEATRPGRAWLAWAAIANLALVMLSGSRTAMLASLVFLAVYAFVSFEFRKILRDHRAHALVGAGLLALFVVWHFPELQARLWTDEGLRPSGRLHLWHFYLDQFLVSPIFGRGFGAGLVAAADWLEFYPTPHNEYLHLLVTGGVVGFVLCLAGIGLWFRQLLARAGPQDRPFLTAIIPAMAVHGLADNLLTYPASLALFAYLGALLTGAPVAEGHGATTEEAGEHETNRPRSPG